MLGGNHGSLLYGDVSVMGMQMSADFTRSTAKIDNFLMNKSDILSHCISKQSIVQNYVIFHQSRTHSEKVD